MFSKKLSPVLKAAYKLGGLNKRYKIREVLRKAYEELKKMGIMEPKL